MGVGFKDLEVDRSVVPTECSDYTPMNIETSVIILVGSSLVDGVETSFSH